jgi:hypothetical protein
MVLRQHARSARRGDNAEVSEVDPSRWGEMFVERDGVSEIWVSDGGDWRRVHRACAIRAWRSNAHTLSDVTWTAMSFDREERDTDSVWAATASQFLPSVPGYYLVTGSCAFSSDATGWRWIAIQVNGAQYMATNMAPGDGTEDTHISIAHIVYLDGFTDYVEIVVRQSSGGDLDTVSTADAINNASRYCGAIALVGAVDQW